MRQANQDRLHRAAHGQQGSGARARNRTILLQVHLLRLKGTTFNAVDTPGHADFGGEVEVACWTWSTGAAARGLHRGADDADQVCVGQSPAEGPQADRRLNKVDRPAVMERGCAEVESKLFDLFAAMGARATSSWTSPSSTVRPRSASARHDLATAERCADERESGRALGQSALLDALRERTPPAARLSRRSVSTPRVHDRARPVRRQARHRPRGERRSEAGVGDRVKALDRARRGATYGPGAPQDGPRDQALHQQGRREASAGPRRSPGTSSPSRARAPATPTRPPRPPTRRVADAFGVNGSLGGREG